MGRERERLVTYATHTGGYALLSIRKSQSVIIMGNQRLVEREQSFLFCQYVDKKYNHSVLERFYAVCCWRMSFHYKLEKKQKRRGELELENFILHGL